MVKEHNKNGFQKKICFVIPYWSSPFGTGGAELQCFFLSEELIKRGWEVEVVTKKLKYDKNKKNIFFNGKVKYRYFKQTDLLIFDFFAILFQLFKTRSYFYYNRTNARFLRATCGLYCKLFNKKNIFALANDVDVLNIPFYDKHVKNKSMTGRIKFLNSWIMDKLIRKYAFLNNYYIAQTYVQKQLLKENSNEESEVVRNSLVYPEKRNIPKENIILWVSNVRPQKRVHLLKKLADELELDNWKIIMIGNYAGYEEIVDSISNPNFKALGRLPYEEALQWYEKSKIFINTSSHEGFPNSFIQSWYFKALIVSYEFDPDGLLNEMKYGYCANADFKKFKEILIEKIQSEDYKEVIERAYNFSLKEFNIKENTSKFISIIE